MGLEGNDIQTRVDGFYKGSCVYRIDKYEIERMTLSGYKLFVSKVPCGLKSLEGILGVHSVRFPQRNQNDIDDKTAVKKCCIGISDKRVV